MKVSKKPELREIIDRLRDKARRKVPDSDAEDLVQEVLVVLVERMQRNLPIDSLQAYADGVLRHVIYDYYQRKRELLLPNEAALEQPSHTPTPEQRVVWMRHLRVIEQLAEENRIDHSLMTEHFMGGAPLREVANQLDVSPGVVNGRLYRFRQKLMKHAGSCFAWVLAITTGLWHRVARANTLSQIPQTALSSAGLLAAGSLVAAIWWGHSTPTPSQQNTSHPIHSVTAAAHPSLLQHLKATQARHTQRMFRQKLTLQWKNKATQPRPHQKSNSRLTVIAHRANRPAQQKQRVAGATLQMRHKSPAYPKRASLSQGELPKSLQAPPNGVQPDTPYRAPVVTLSQRSKTLAPTQPARLEAQPSPVSVLPKAQRQAQPRKVAAAPRRTQAAVPAPSVAAFGSLVKASANVRSARSPSATPKSVQPKPTTTAAKARPTPQPTTPGPTPTQQARPTPQPTATAPTRSAGVPTLRALSALSPLQAIDAPAQGSIPNAGPASQFAATPRHSFCMVNDGRVYRCDSGRMDDISGPHNTTFGCQDTQCRGMIGDGPTLVLTHKGEIYIVGPRHFHKSSNNGLSWTVPNPTLSTAQLLSQSSLILNQQGELWQSQQKKWKQVRTNQPGVHEVRVHLDKGRLQIEDDAGFHFKLDWKTTTTTAPAVSNALSKQINTSKMSPTQAHKAPSIAGKKPQDSTPLPPQKDTPIKTNP